MRVLDARVLDAQHVSMYAERAQQTVFRLDWIVLPSHDSLSMQVSSKHAYGIYSGIGGGSGVKFRVGV